MVRREGTRFGVTTGHSVRRLTHSQRTVHSSQNIVVKATADVKINRVQKQASTVVENHLQNRALKLKGFDREAVLQFSLNKSKRWEAIDSLKREIGSICCHGNRITVSEHHVGVGNSEDDCTAVYDSMCGKPKCYPRKTYSRAADLVMKETELATGHSLAEDEDFGTKNRRRRRKKKVKVDKRTGIQEEAFAVNVSYAVNLAAPRHTMYTYPKRGLDHGMGDSNNENTVLQATRQGTKKRNKKISRDIQADLDSLRQLNSEEDLTFYSEDEDNWVELDGTRHIPRSEVVAPFGMFVLPADRHSSKCASKKNSRLPQGACTKERVFQVEEELEEEKGSTREVEDNAILRLAISADSLRPDVLREEFGEDYNEARCFPRRFAVDVTERVFRKTPVLCNVSDTLLSNGYHVYAIFSLQPQNEGARREVEVSAMLVGERFNQMDAEKAIYGYRDEIKSLSDAVERIVDIAAYRLEYERLPCELGSSHLVKVKSMKYMPLTTVGASLNWEAENLFQQQIIRKQIRASDEEQHISSGSLSPLSCEDDENTCRICYSGISATYPGTHLQTCKHMFCDECWKGYLMAKVSQGDSQITCPEFNCKVPIDVVTVMSLVPYKLASFHLQQKINAAVAADTRLQWCPSKGCGRLARLTADPSNGVSIACECGFACCTLCKQEIHWPATCVQAATYRKEKADVLKYVNAENASIVDQVIYKECPQCGNPIEKIYGCNVVSCPCKCVFCWVCGELYANHERFHYKCKQPQKECEVVEFEGSPMEHVYQLSVMYHFRASRMHSSIRNNQALKLANKVVVAMALERKPKEASRQAAECTSTTTKAISVLSRMESETELLREIQDLFKRSSDLVVEAFSVLEFFEILLEYSPSCDLKRSLCQMKFRLAFISQQLDDILNQRVLDLKGCIERVRTLHDNGKRVLYSIGKAASDLRTMKEIPINLPNKEQ